MKNVYLFAMLVLSIGAFAQQRVIYKVEPSYAQQQRSVGRQQNNSYTYTYDANKYDYKGLDLSRSQKRDLDELMFQMHNEIKLAHRNYRRPEAQIRKIEKAYDLHISKILTKYQYDKFMRMYAYQYPGFGYGRA